MKELALEEASCEGYVKYAPITRGPIINGIILLTLSFVVPFYYAWSLVSRAVRRIHRE